MNYRVVITEAARMDLYEISRYIRLENPLRSESFVDELLQRCISLRDFPKSYALIFDPKSRGVRRLVHGDYLVFFRIKGMVVDVIHVLNGAQDYRKLLFPEDEG